MAENPYPAPQENGSGHAMSPTIKLTAWLVLGIILMLAPCLGTIPGVIAQLVTFRHLDQPGAQAAFDAGIHLSTRLTVAGLVAFPFGIGIVIVSAIKLSRRKNSTDSSQS